jgi:hypothetical protein
MLPPDFKDFLCRSCKCEWFLFFSFSFCWILKIVLKIIQSMIYLWCIKLVALKFVWSSGNTPAFGCLHATQDYHSWNQESWVVSEESSHRPDGWKDNGQPFWRVWSAHGLNRCMLDNLDMDLDYESELDIDSSGEIVYAL